MRHLLLVFLLAVTGRLVAAPLEYPDNNFTIAVPEGWEKIEAPDPNITVALQNQTGGEIVLISAVKLPENERQTGPRDVRSGMIGSYKKAGFTIDSESETKVNYVPYLVVKAHNDVPKYIYSYVTSADGTIYAFQHIAEKDEPNGGPGFKTVLEGFKLIKPALFVADPEAQQTAAYKFGYQLGAFLRVFAIPIFLFLLLAGVGLCIFLIVRKKKRRRRRI